MTRLKYVRAIRIAVVAVAALGLLMAGTQFRHKRHAGILPIVHASAGCSDSSLRGRVAFQLNGNIIGLGPIGGVGVTTYDGAGHFTNTDNVNVNGFGVVLNRPGSGTYHVNPDCTGTQILVSGGQVIHQAFVIAGKQGFTVVTDPGAVITAVSTQMDAEDEE